MASFLSPSFSYRLELSRYIAKFGGAERVKAMETAMIQRGKEVEPPINLCVSIPLFAPSSSMRA